MDAPAPTPPPTDPAVARRQALGELLGRAEQAAKARRFGEAIGICQDILDSDANCAPALAVLGAIEGSRGDLARATGLLERALAADPSIAVWHGNLSGLYRVQYRLDEALASAREAVRLRPDAVRNHLSLGKVHVDRGERDEAIACFFDALARDPRHAEAHLAIGQVLLARGDMRPGWIEYEWRNQLEQAKGTLPAMTTPIWNGMHLPKGRILLVGDQGFGDTLQFCRFVPMVAARCGQVVVGCSPDLLPLVRGMRGVAQAFSRWNEIPAHTAHCLMSSLPGTLGTEVGNIPAEVPYVVADPAAIQAWAERLDQRLEPRESSERLRVGIVWAGRPTHPNDRRRSIALADLAPLAAVGSAALVSLQKWVPPRDQAARAAMPRLVELSDGLTDFAQTAAVIANLDLVITVDSAVAHLAGAMARPVWVMVPRPADWRWMLDRSDSPWYPTMRLFRQPRPGDWASVIAEIAPMLGRARRVPAGPGRV